MVILPNNYWHAVDILLFKRSRKWPHSQKQRAKLIFEKYPRIKLAYGPLHETI